MPAARPGAAPAHGSRRWQAAGVTQLLALLLVVAALHATGNTRWLELVAALALMVIGYTLAYAARRELYAGIHERTDDEASRREGSQT